MQTNLRKDLNTPNKCLRNFYEIKGNANHKLTFCSFHFCLGCYGEESMVNSTIIYESNLTFMAPGFCQEICLDKNASLFAVQVFTLLPNDSLS